MGTMPHPGRGGLHSERDFTAKGQPEVIWSSKAADAVSEDCACGLPVESPNMLIAHDCSTT